MNNKIRSDQVKAVDGFLIRNTLDDDFGVLHRRGDGLGHFSPKFYIPEGEIWLDHRFVAEIDFLLAAERFISPASLTYEAERALMKDKLCLETSPPNYIRREEAGDGFTLKYVDGAIVRRYLDPEFIFGGHDLVYPAYIPSGEIWLDDLADPAELPYFLVHEKVERELMMAGKPYDIAHEFAIAADKEARRGKGVGSYPGDSTYPWRYLTNREIIAKYYVAE